MSYIIKAKHKHAQGLGFHTCCIQSCHFVGICTSFVWVCYHGYLDLEAFWLSCNFGVFPLAFSLSLSYFPFPNISKTNLRVVVFTFRHVRGWFLLMLLVVELAKQKSPLKEKADCGEHKLPFLPPSSLSQLLGSAKHTRITTCIKLQRFVSTCPFPVFLQPYPPGTCCGQFGDYHVQSVQYDLSKPT